MHHNLLSHSLPEAVTRIYSKPEALAQCRKWLSTRVKHAEVVPAASTSKAAELAANEPTSAAIASSLASEVYGVPIQCANVEDNPHNVTRFFVIGNEAAKPTGDDKTSMMFTTEHTAGALTRVLDVFRDFGINMTHIDNRPSQRTNWEYIFFVDVIGHASDPNVLAAIEVARKHCHQLTIIGTYPRAEGVL